MIKLLKDWGGKIEIDDKTYNGYNEINDFKSNRESIHIILYSAKKNSTETQKSSVLEHSEDVTEYEITVKKYMTEKASPSFDFMAKFNNDVPMPMRVMQGTVEKETRGMIYMNLHGFARATITCACCGKELTNPISRHYGIGPICLSKLGIVRNIEDVENIKEELMNIKWSGWVIKSAITNKVEL